MPGKASVLEDECVSCGACELVCPRKAISVYRGMYARADAGRCVGCGICAKKCPAGVISVNMTSLRGLEGQA